MQLPKASPSPSTLFTLPSLWIPWTDSCRKRGWLLWLWITFPCSQAAICPCSWLIPERILWGMQTLSGVPQPSCCFLGCAPAAWLPAPCIEGVACIFFFPFQSFTSCSLCRSLWPGVSLQLPSSTPSPANNTNLRIFFILSHKAFLCLPCSLLCLGKKSVHRTSTRISLKLVLKTHFCCETLEKREGGLVTEIRKESPNLALASAAAICACVSADLFMIFQSSPSFFLFLPHLFLVPHPQFMLNINYAPQQRHRVFTCILNSAAFFFLSFYIYIFFFF